MFEKVTSDLCFNCRNNNTEFNHFTLIYHLSCQATPHWVPTLRLGNTALKYKYCRDSQTWHSEAKNNLWKPLFNIAPFFIEKEVLFK